MQHLKQFTGILSMYTWSHLQNTMMEKFCAEFRCKFQLQKKMLTAVTLIFCDGTKSNCFPKHGGF